jgi:hypothetical protein
MKTVEKWPSRPRAGGPPPVHPIQSSQLSPTRCCAPLARGRQLGGSCAPLGTKRRALTTPYLTLVRLHTSGSAGLGTSGGAFSHIRWWWCLLRCVASHSSVCLRLLHLSSSRVLGCAGRLSLCREPPAVNSAGSAPHPSPRARLLVRICRLAACSRLTQRLTRAVWSGRVSRLQLTRQQQSPHACLLVRICRLPLTHSAAVVWSVAATCS